MYFCSLLTLAIGSVYYIFQKREFYMGNIFHVETLVLSPLDQFIRRISRHLIISLFLNFSVTFLGPHFYQWSVKLLLLLLLQITVISALKVRAIASLTHSIIFIIVVPLLFLGTNWKQ